MNLKDYFPIIPLIATYIISLLDYKIVNIKSKFFIYTLNTLIAIFGYVIIRDSQVEERELLELHKSTNQITKDIKVSQKILKEQVDSFNLISSEINRLTYLMNSNYKELQLLNDLNKKQLDEEMKKAENARSKILVTPYCELLNDSTHFIRCKFEKTGERTADSIKYVIAFMQFGDNLNFSKYYISINSNIDSYNTYSLNSNGSVLNVTLGINNENKVYHNKAFFIINYKWFDHYQRKYTYSRYIFYSPDILKNKSNFGINFSKSDSKRAELVLSHFYPLVFDQIFKDNF